MAIYNLTKQTKDARDKLLSDFRLNLDIQKHEIDNTMAWEGSRKYAISGSVVP